MKHPYAGQVGFGGVFHGYVIFNVGPSSHFCENDGSSLFIEL